MDNHFNHTIEKEFADRLLCIIEKKAEEILSPLLRDVLYKYIEDILVQTPVPIEQSTTQPEETSFTFFAQKQISYMKKQKRQRTAGNYQTALNSFARYFNNRKIAFKDITEARMIAYQEWLVLEDVGMNTISCYMRALRSIYNKAVKNKLTLQCYPFKQVYTQIGETTKRAISANCMQKLQSLPLKEKSLETFVRDLFLFCFYTRGMSFVDMAYLKKKQIQDGYIIYRRRKTHQEIRIKLEPCMQKIIEKYTPSHSDYVFPILTFTDESKTDTQYRSKGCYYNRLLKELGRQAKIEIPLSFYVARHTWASLAFRQKVDLGVISKALGHTSLKTTLIYIKSIENETAVNEANSGLIKIIFN